MLSGLLLLPYELLELVRPDRPRHLLSLIIELLDQRHVPVFHWGLDLCKAQ